jgi:addiction module HigA family antidote
MGLSTHPGDTIWEDFLTALHLSVTEAAKGLGVTRKTLSSILNGRSGVTAEMALRLSHAFGSTPEHWLQMQLLPTICGKRRAAPRSCTSSSSSPRAPG